MRLVRSCCHERATEPLAPGRHPGAFVNKLSFRRWTDHDADVEHPGRRSVEIAVPMVDGVPLFELVKDRYPGLVMSLVARPSKQLLGGASYVEDGRTVLLDGGCGVAGCCGVMATISVTREQIVWSDFFARGRSTLPPNLHFTFDRDEYERALAKLPDVPTIDIPVSEAT